ncbi:class I SAM-dependent methyltransferase [Paenibacillus aurantiacus]|uniref:Class I SAM-dependent methyltransferase n=1 Tax=Paenibacillus aurantiacus TaxID=1936118 RepID=A0ABV5KLA3_9BACL
MKAWFERSFGSDYMIVYRHRNRAQAAAEAQRMAGWLQLPEGAEVLDIGCGMGRHAQALSDMGYRVSGVDLSEALLAEAKAHNKEGRVTFSQGDMRELPYGDAAFRATVNLFTSFGYFEEEADNDQVLREIRRVLRPDGQFLIDFMNPAYVKKHLVPHSRRIDEQTGLVIEECRSIAEGWVTKRIGIGLPGEPARTYEERVRLLPLEWFEQALDQAGLRIDRVYGNYGGAHYAPDASQRMIIAGRVKA